MDKLIIPKGLKVTFEAYDMFSAPGRECTRIEVIVPNVGAEVAYWYTDGDNDIMQGRKGTLLEAAQALVNFTAKS